MINFKEAKTKEDIIKVCSENYLEYENYCNVGIMEIGFIRYKNLDEEKEKKLIDVAHLTDKEFKIKDFTDEERNLRKISTVMTSTVLLDKYYDKVKSLTPEELIILSNFMSTAELYLFNDILKLYNKNIMESINHKSDNFLDKEFLIEFSYEKLKEEGITSNKIEKFIEETSKEELENMHNESMEETKNELYNKHGIRI